MLFDVLARGRPEDAAGVGSSAFARTAGSFVDDAAQKYEGDGCKSYHEARHVKKIYHEIRVGMRG